MEKSINTNYEVPKSHYSIIMKKYVLKEGVANCLLVCVCTTTTVFSSNAVMKNAFV